MVRNIILTLGLGTMITTNDILEEYDVRKTVGLPDHLLTLALAIGYQIRKTGPLVRRPVSEVIYPNAGEKSR